MHHADVIAIGAVFRAYTAFYKVKRKISPERIVEVYITIDGKGEMLRDKTDMFGITSL